MYNCKNVDINNTEKICIYGRIINTKSKSKICFIILGYQNYTIQCIAEKKNITNFTNLCNLGLQTLVQCYGYIKQIPGNIEKIKNVSPIYSQIEFHICDFLVIKECSLLPILVNDIDNSGIYENGNSVGNNLRYNYRWIDMRAQKNLAKIKLKSHMIKYFSTFMIDNDFTQINSPKIIGLPSESGSHVFELDYFGQKAFLAQSPQLYKQMAIVGDLDRVFEIGPVFRAEESNTNRHLTEFTGLDIEMVIPPNENYTMVINTLYNLLVYMFDNIKLNHMDLVNILKEKENFIEPIYSREPLILSFEQGAELLMEKNIVLDLSKDIGTTEEFALGQIVREKYNTDLFVLDKYPKSVRPFYTKQYDDKFTCSYDIIFRGKEICSGSQRINDYDELLENINNFGLDSKLLGFYLDMFKSGCLPHGGGGFGLERIMMTYFNGNNIADYSFCPRKIDRLIP